MKKVLILCTGNSCRSQIAEGYLKYFADAIAEVYSAGIETHGVNPKAIDTMLEDSIDISKHTSNHIDEYRGFKFDFVITVCDNAFERCPYFPGNTQRLHHNFPDPSKLQDVDETHIKEEFRRVRGMIKDYIKQFTATYLN